MEVIEAKRQRNQTLECCRIAAAILVVFLHVPFPAVFGKVLARLARIAVPMFFAISGWFSYRTPPEKLLRRFGRILLLEAAGIGVTVLWQCMLTLSWGGSVLSCLQELVPSAEELTRWLLWNVDPFAGHLWYLSAMAACYGVLWLYTLAFRGKEADYKYLYVISGILLTAHFAMGNFSDFTGITVDYTVYRNAWFFGIPMFVMGIFLQQYRDRLPKKTGLVLLLSIGLSLLEQWTFGPSDLPMGMVPAAAALLLLTAAHPAVPVRLNRAVNWFGPLSTAVYIIHLVIHDVYQNFLIRPAETVFGGAADWLRPLIVAGLSLAVSTVWLLAKNAARKLRK